jgi:anthranilate synthase component II
MPLELVMVDNYDSFTFNLVQYFEEFGAKVRTVRNDQVKASELFKDNIHGLIISPGPGDPKDAGISVELVKLCTQRHLPMLGVCLGHQAIGFALGGKIIKNTPCHGKAFDMAHNSQDLFKGLPSPLKATRYHSLVVERSSLPSCLRVTCELADGTIMGLKHNSAPIHGVQFHPESILTETGKAMIKNFLEIIRDQNPPSP